MRCFCSIHEQYCFFAVLQNQDAIQQCFSKIVYCTLIHVDLYSSFHNTNCLNYPLRLSYYVSLTDSWVADCLCEVADYSLHEIPWWSAVPYRSLSLPLVHIWFHIGTNWSEWPLILDLKGLVIGEVGRIQPLFTHVDPYWPIGAIWRQLKLFSSRKGQRACGMEGL